MTTFYLDPIGGSDAGAGTSFATRWKTITSGATAARTAAGDTIRIIASPDPTSLGQTATWTDNSDTVTLTTAVTADISQATAAWTASSNITTTTSTSRKIGATSSSIAAATAFTTGKAAYTTISSTDFSAYQQVSFWIKQTAGTLASADGEISIKLCSDTLGATPVNTINIPRIRMLNQWQAYTIDTGGALGSAIQSVAFYINTDQGAQTFLINNILAVKSVASADSLSLTSRISKNTGNEDWYHIKSISGTSVVLETIGITNDTSTNSGVQTKYSGTTESVTTYKREPLFLDSSLVNTGGDTVSIWGQIQESGTAGSPITYSGGWDRTNMSTQSGNTFISGVNGSGHGITLNDMSYITFDKINLSRFYMGIKMFRTSGVCSNINVTAKSFSANTNCAIRLGSGGTAEAVVDSTFTIDNLNCNGGANGLQAVIHDSQGCIKRNTFTVVNMNSNYAYCIYLQGIALSGSQAAGVQSTANTFNITNMKRNSLVGTLTNFIQSSVGNTFNVANYVHSGAASVIYPWYLITASGNGVQGPEANKFVFTNVLTGGSTTGSYGIYLGSTDSNYFDLTGCTVSAFDYGIGNLSNSFYNKVRGGTFSGNALSDVAQFGAGQIAFNGTTLSSTTKTLFSTENLSGYGQINMSNYGATADDHRNFFQGGTIQSDATTRHTASGISWKMSPTSTTYTTSTVPLVLPLSQFAVNANALVTVSVWVYRSNTGITATLKCPGGQIAGVSADVTSSASGSASTWEQLTITFTPTEKGVISVELDAYGGTTYSVYVDDFSVSQA